MFRRLPWIVLALGGCAPFPEMGPPGETSRSCEAEGLLPVPLDRRVDLLLVIDDSPSMAGERAGLMRNLALFGHVLETMEGGLPSLHLAVVSTDGSGRFHAPPACGVDGSFLVDEREPGWTCDQAPGSTCRVKNYEGPLSEAIACLGDLEPRGQELAQPLEAARRALESRPEGAGFRRVNAFLGVVFLTDEDDCSGAVSAFFDSPFGCVQDGVTCDGGPVLGEPTSYEACEPRTGLFVRHPDEYAGFLRSLVADPALLIVAAAAGPPSPVAVERADDGSLRLSPSCSSPHGEATPAIRLDHFLGQFPHRSTFASICSEDYSHVLGHFAELLAQSLGAPCVEADPTDLDPDEPGIQPDCNVAYVDARTGRETPIPRCPMIAPDIPDPAELPCWWVEDTSDFCLDTLTAHIATLDPPRLGFYRWRCATICD